MSLESVVIRKYAEGFERFWLALKDLEEATEMLEEGDFIYKSKVGEIRVELDKLWDIGDMLTRKIEGLVD